MATITAASNVENPTKTLPQPQPLSPNPTATTEEPHPPATTKSALSASQEQTKPASRGGDESKKTTGSNTGALVEPAVAASNSSFSNDFGTVNSIQRKMKRAERFGVPVQLSEEEKRNSRVERFGTGPAVHGSDASKSSEEQKRKARAERFGLVHPLSADEEEKKKARVERFGAVTKTDTLEEEKKKSRAIRFTQSQPTTISTQKDGGPVQSKQAIAGKVGGGA